MTPQKTPGHPRIDPLTEQEKALWPDQPLSTLDAPFVDDRGKIQPLVDLMMRSAVMISSVRPSLK